MTAADVKEIVYTVVFAVAVLQAVIGATVYAVLRAVGGKPALFERRPEADHAEHRHDRDGSSRVAKLYGSS